MKALLTAVCCFAMVSMPVLGQKKATEKGDQKFVDMAAQIDMVEANLGQLAATNGESQDVKDYGQMLVTDHTKDYQQLQDVAKQAGLTVPSAIDAAHNKAMIDPFQKLKGAAFDKKFAMEMMGGHEKAVGLYQKESTEATDANVKSYAAQALPVLQKHLDEAKKLGKADAGKK